LPIQSRPATSSAPAMQRMHAGPASYRGVQQQHIQGSTSLRPPPWQGTGQAPINPVHNTPLYPSSHPNVPGQHTQQQKPMQPAAQPPHAPTTAQVSLQPAQQQQALAGTGGQAAAPRAWPQQQQANTSPQPPQHHWQPAQQQQWEAMGSSSNGPHQQANQGGHHHQQQYSAGQQPQNWHQQQQVPAGATKHAPLPIQQQQSHQQPVASGAAHTQAPLPQWHQGQPQPTQGSKGTGAAQNLQGPPQQQGAQQAGTMYPARDTQQAQLAPPAHRSWQPPPVQQQPPHGGQGPAHVHQPQGHHVHKTQIQNMSAGPPMRPAAPGWQQPQHQWQQHLPTGQGPGVQAPVQAGSTGQQPLSREPAWAGAPIPAQSTQAHHQQQQQAALPAGVQWVPGHNQGPQASNAPLPACNHQQHQQPAGLQPPPGNAFDR
jgi:hypothetical protein